MYTSQRIAYSHNIYYVKLSADSSHPMMLSLILILLTCYLYFSLNSACGVGQAYALLHIILALIV